MVTLQRSLFMVLLCLRSAIALSQTEVTSVQVDAHVFSPSTFLSLSIQHFGAPRRILLLGSISTTDGQPVVQFRSGEFSVLSGEQFFAASNIQISEFKYAANDLSKATLRDQQLPGGTYRICIDAFAGGEALSPFCETFEVEDQLFLDLTEPWDRDTIDEVRPSLFWTISGTSLDPRSMELLLVLAPLGLEGSAQRAVGSAVPVLKLRKPNYPVVQYPSGAPSLQRGRCYAWQISALRSGLVRERSEAWSFCVRGAKQLPDARYIVLGDHGDPTVHRAIEERLFFRFDEPYSVDSVRCEVLNAERIIISPDAKLIGEQDVMTSPNLRSIGVNLYEFDLASYGLPVGRYELRVKDGKERARSLLFSIDAP